MKSTPWSKTWSLFNLSPDLTKKKRRFLGSFENYSFLGEGDDLYKVQEKKWGKDLLILGANVTFIQNLWCQYFRDRDWGEIRATAHWKHPLWSTVVLDYSLNPYLGSQPIMLWVHGMSFHPLGHWDTIWYGPHYFWHSLNTKWRGAFFYPPSKKKKKKGWGYCNQRRQSSVPASWPGLVPALMLYYGV